MTSEISGQTSLLASLLANELREKSTTRSTVGEPDGIFSGKLDTILNGTEPTIAAAQGTNQSLAESLNLKMLQTTLSLAMDATDSTHLPSLFDRPSPTIQSLIKTYSSNQAAADKTSTEQSSTTQPLPEIPVTSPGTGTPAVTDSHGNQWLDPIIAKASQRYGVEIGLIKAVIKAESNFNPNAVSHAGARGLMQLMPGTARSLGVKDSFNPEQNVMGGTRFLGDLLNRYNGNIDSALAAYNWGPGNVDKRPDHLPRETRDYLVRVKQLYSSYSA